ncbi:MAG TPA: hypothetical protein VHB72_00010 [Candidatus Saccharimonadales bacterium]|nr:hypothetical protein [Candidatus Saccharimonadales bacterium]
MPPQSPQNPYQPQQGPQQPVQPQPQVGPQPMPQPQQPGPVTPQAPQPGQPAVQPNEYAFIMEPAKPPRQKLNLIPAGSSLPIRIAVVGGGIIILIILFTVIKGLVTTPPFDTTAMIGLAQDQQEMIHITSQALQQSKQQQAALSQNTMNFAVTAQASLSSDQNQTLTYLKNNGKKVKSGTLNQKVSATTDSQLSTAASNSTFESTYVQLMETELKNYQTALKTTFVDTKGAKGRQLLNQEYTSSQLLLNQLQNSPGAPAGT